MKEEAKTKIHEKAHSLRKGSKAKVTKVKSKELVLQFFGISKVHIRKGT